MKQLEKSEIRFNQLKSTTLNYSPPDSGGVAEGRGGKNSNEIILTCLFQAQFQ